MKMTQIPQHNEIHKQKQANSVRNSFGGEERLWKEFCDNCRVVKPSVNSCPEFLDISGWSHNSQPFLHTSRDWSDDFLIWETVFKLAEMQSLFIP